MNDQKWIEKLLAESDWQILSIASAGDGWRVVLVNEDEQKWFTFPVACWALVRRTVEDDDGKKRTETEVVPIIPDVAANTPTGLEVMNASNLVGIAAPNEDPQAVVDRNKCVRAMEWALEHGPVGSG